MIPKLISKALKNKRIHAYLRRVYESHVRAELKATSPCSVDIPEIMPILCRPSEIREARINLLVPALSTRHVFGGIATALKFFHRLGNGYEGMRIILTDQANFSHEDNPDYSRWFVASLNNEDRPGLSVVPAGSRYGETLAVGPDDIFIATAWWTALLANGILDQQTRIFASGCHDKKFVYLIQDYEPGFYPWSSRYALAESTYDLAHRYIPVFNSSVLKEFFLEEGYGLEGAFCFEPVLGERLKAALATMEHGPRGKRILIYGRPSVQRNAFEVIVMALRQWAAKGQDGWEIFSAGEDHPNVDLGAGKTLVSLGKLDLEQYAKNLSTSYAGISLMISPHPSYPPLEMATFGIKVITNDYKNKNLSSFSRNIKSIKHVSPQEVCDALLEITNGYEQAGGIGYTDFGSGSAIYSGDQLEVIADRVAETLLAVSDRPRPYACDARRVVRLYPLANRKDRADQ